MAFEVALLLFLAVVIIAGLLTLGKPMMDVFAEKMTFKLREMGSESEQHFKDKINILEGELLAVKQQVNAMQETIDFLSKEIESQHQGGTIKTRRAEEQER